MLCEQVPRKHIEGSLAQMCVCVCFSLLSAKQAFWYTPNLFFGLLRHLVFNAEHHLVYTFVPLTAALPDNGGKQLTLKGVLRSMNCVPLVGYWTHMRGAPLPKLLGAQLGAYSPKPRCVLKATFFFGVGRKWGRIAPFFERLFPFQLCRGTPCTSENAWYPWISTGFSPDFNRILTGLYGIWFNLLDPLLGRPHLAGADFWLPKIRVA